MTDFSKGSLPFTYLGVPIFKDKVKSIYLKVIADMIISKLNSLKDSSLSMAGRVLLVKFVIQNMLTHIITSYNWPITLLKEIGKASRNFIWIGAINDN